jgi:hypothetical protein
LFELKAIFKFICRNPPTAMIGGGVLFFLLGSLLMPVNPKSSEVLLRTAPWLIAFGILLHTWWLYRNRH